MTKLIGPCKVDCDEGCDVPAGVELSIVPVPRHAWSDVVVCPNARADGFTPCGLAFLVIRDPNGVRGPGPSTG